MSNNNENIEKDTILIAKMYTGRYVNRRFNNIGHEIINFIKPDNEDEIYGYITHDGKIGNKYKKRIKTILFISNAKNGKAKIIAKVEKPTILTENECKEKQEKIEYGSKPLADIMEQCVKDIYRRYITYKCDEKNIQFAKEEKYIDVQNLNKKDNQCVIPYLRTKTYKSKADKKVYDKIINKVIENEKIWEDNKNSKIKRITEREKEEYRNLGDNNSSFMDLVQAEYNEEIISNMLKYYFEKENVFKRFINKLAENKELKMEKINIGENIKLYREKYVKISKKGSNEQGRIDLFIEDEINKNVIVIENKIESGIHGKAYEDGKTQKSQLEVYYDWVYSFKEDDNKEEKYKNYNKKFLIFVPNYRKDEIEDELEQYYKKQKDNKIHEEYKIITYSEIYNFFKDSSNLKFEENSREYYYFQDFLNVLSIHKTESNYEMIRRRFINAINKTNKKTGE